MQEHELGEIGYRAYSKAVGGVSVVTGDALPEFSATPEAVQIGWTAAAKAIADEVLTELKPSNERDKEEGTNAEA